jgi:hypothetical protein
MLSNPVRAALARALLLVAALAGWTLPARAAVEVHFHSFNGSMFAARYPHTFVVFEGTLEATGERVFENFGFSARSATPDVLLGPVAHKIYTEDDRYIRTTNRHFSITVSDDTYRRMKDEVVAWRDAPGRYYDLDTRNCIHFVGRIAALAGLRVDYPKGLLRKPKAWLNHITTLNPHLGARLVR